MPSKPYCYEYPRPAVTVDLVVFAHLGPEPVVLLVRRGREPFQGCWAIPGGFLDLDEEVEDGARRELREETGLVFRGPLALLGVFGTPGRDPRGRTISLVHAAYLPGGPVKVTGGDDAAQADWRPAVADDPATPLAFDHDEILRRGLDWLGRLDGSDPAGPITT